MNLKVKLTAFYWAIAVSIFLMVLSACRERKQTEASPDDTICPTGVAASASRITEKTGKRENANTNSDYNSSEKINLANLTSKQIANLLPPISEPLRNPYEIAKLSVFAKHAGAEKNITDFNLILSYKTNAGQLQAILKEYFKSATNGSPDQMVESMIESINPGAKRATAIKAYFSELNLSVNKALEIANQLSYPEDHLNALRGLASSRTWLPTELESLPESKDLESTVKLFYEQSMINSMCAEKSNWEDESWDSLIEVKDPSRRRMLARVLFSTIGVRQPESAIELLSKLPEIERNEILSNSGSANVVASWCDQDPESCLKYLEASSLTTSTMERLISKGINQWIRADSVIASQWISNNIDKPYIKSSVEALIFFLEQRGENATPWKATLAEIKNKETTR